METDPMNASQRAYEYLESHQPGMYAELVECVLENGGSMIQTPEYFAAYIVRDGEAHVLYACGNLAELLRYARDNAESMGYDRISWERSIAGKHRNITTYTLEKLCRKK